MLRYILLRLFGLVLVLLVVSFVTFGMLYNVPGGPFDQSEQPLSAAALANVRAKYNLDKPFYVVWASYISHAVRGDFGTSYKAENKSILEIFQQQWGTSLQLGMMALAWSVPLGVTLGVVAALRPNSATDYLVRFVAILGTTVPNFAIAVFMTFLLSVVWKLLPTGGWLPMKDPRTLVMPVFIFGILPFGVLVRYARNGILEVFTQDYMRTARAKGVPYVRVLFKHGLRNVLIPLITVMAPIIPNALTGSAILEKIFRINGIGRYFIDSIGQRDYPMVMALVLIVTVLWGISYLAGDVLYTVADPRVRLRR